jgi:hypothetical protein
MGDLPNCPGELWFRSPHTTSSLEVGRGNGSTGPGYPGPPPPFFRCSPMELLGIKLILYETSMNWYRINWKRVYLEILEF